MALVYSHNKSCDVKNWVGELTLGEFEDEIFIDEVLELSPLDSYEGAIESFWPLFIQDSALL